MAGGAGACAGEARSVALETAYVHDVYEEISGASSTNCSSRAWPKVAQFLHDLEPGALVCDVGCGNGKYLSINPAVFKIGADRCLSLTELARENQHEVLVCDNLALPFRDECFDAVLSVAVVHHLATTERRVSAIRELTRVLRIGGRLVITVWAMEQRHRKFESQDVLVPWHRPQRLSTPSLELTSTTTSEEDLHPPYHAYTQTSDSDSGSGQRGAQRGRRDHGLDPALPVSQSSSSLSSPNETCYSFVRRALQRLAGSKRSAPWFLDSWSASALSPLRDLPNRHEPEGCEDIQDLPIELRRLEEDVDQIYNRADADDALPLHLKSKSLSDILGGDPADPRAVLVRSRSSVPSMALGSNAQQQQQQQQQISRQVQQSSSSSLSSKPRLVKQKQSMCEEAEEAAGGDQPTDMRNLVRALPDFKRLHGGRSVFKQSSMNEELMSTERLREKERVRQNIQKQASLNEELMYRHRPGLGHGAPGTLDSLRDTLFSASAAKRFQLLKIGLTSKLKSSTTNIEKVAGTSLKNGFVRILQGWKQAGEPLATSCTSPASGPLAEAHEQRPAGGGGGGPFGVAERERHERHERQERRHSREDGSDSSKDSSLQSDTSVDSEDSFASVIFVPKPDQFDPLGPKTPSPTLCTSAPASPQPSSLPGSLPSSPKVLLYSHSPVPSPTLPPNVPLSPRGVGSVGGPVGGAVGVAVLPPCSRAQQDTRLQQLKEALRQRNMAGRGAFPLVSCPPAAPRTAPRLLSLELFNPETDDVDSDSSGVSSPDSVDSVISVAKAAVTAEPAEPSDPADPADCGPSVSRTASCEQLAAQPQHSTSTPASLGLLEAPADGAPEDAVEPVIQASPRARRRQVNLDATDLRVTLRDDTSRSSWSLQLSPDNSPNPSRMTRMKESGSRSSLPGSLAAARGSRGSRGQENTVFKFPQPAHVPDRLRSGRQHDVELPIVLSTKTSDPEAGSGGLADAPSLTAIPETPDPSGLRAGQMQPQPPSASGERSPHSPRRSALPQVPPLVLSPREAQVADGSVGVSSPLEEESWDEGVRQHLAGFAEQLSERLLEEIVRYREDGAVRDLAKLGEELQGLSKLSLELRDRPGSASATGAAAHFDKVLANLAKNVDSSCELLSLLTKNASLASLASLRSVDSSEALTGVSSLSSSIRSTRSTDGDSAPHSELASEASDPETTAPPLPPAVVSRSLAMPPPAPAVVFADSSSAAVAADGPGPGSGSGPGPGLGLGLVPGPAQGQVPGPGPGPHTPQGTPLRPGCSLESSDGGDYSERTGSGYSGYSGYSGTDSRRDTSSASASASLGSAMESMSDVCDAASDCSRDVRFADRRTARCDGRSSSEETPGTPGTPGRQLVRQRALNALQEPPEGHGPHGHGLTKTESCTTSLSGSTSQDSLRSLPSDNANGSGGGGAITYHRYYHVFREGELDQLIERYAENLHIISSYYDHTNWCVVAEKVQVWTI